MERFIHKKKKKNEMLIDREKKINYKELTEVDYDSLSL